MNEKYSILTKLEEIIPHLELLKQLQPELTLDELKNSLKIMLPSGYKIILLEIENNVVGLTGLWINAKLYSGKYAEIDNFIIDKNYRSKGIGKKLCHYVYELARKENCKVVMLDAYTYNTASHKFYFNEGFVIKGFHFIKNL